MKEGNFKMPSPADLAKKDETVNISLRIKQSAVDIFNMLAEKQGSKPGTMMISLIEAYADSYKQKDAENVSVDIMKTYLNRMADKFGKMEDDSLTLRLFKNGWPGNLDKGRMGLESVEEFEAGYDRYVKTHEDEDGDDNKSDEPDDGFLKFPSLYESVKGYSPEYIMGNFDYYQASFFPARNGLKPWIDSLGVEKGDSGDAYFIPADAWKMVVTMLFEYEEKMNDVFPKQKYVITKNMATMIYDAACKEKDHAKLAKAIAKILADFVDEQQND